MILVKKRIHISMYYGGSNGVSIFIALKYFAGVTKTEFAENI